MVADFTKLQTQLAWTPRYADIDTIVGDAWAWEPASRRDPVTVSSAAAA